MSWLSNFLKSPANQTGLIAGGATIAGLVMQYADHNLALSALVGSVAFAVAKIVQPDNTALASDMEALTADAFGAWASKNPFAVAKNLADAGKVANDVMTAAPTTVTPAGVLAAATVAVPTQVTPTTK